MKWRKTVSLTLVLLLTGAALAGCMRSAGNPEPTPGQQAGGAVKPDIPSKLSLEDGVPQLDVSDTRTESDQSMDIESYVQGVLAGEMRADWPMEALKAQAILARTFVLKFVSENRQVQGRGHLDRRHRGPGLRRIQDQRPHPQGGGRNRGEVLSYDGHFPMLVPCPRRRPDGAGHQGAGL
jgi:hypothetical protein